MSDEAQGCPTCRFNWNLRCNHGPPTAVILNGKIVSVLPLTDINSFPAQFCHQYKVKELPSDTD